MAFRTESNEKRDELVTTLAEAPADAPLGESGFACEVRSALTHMRIIIGQVMGLADDADLALAGQPALTDAVSLRDAASAIQTWAVSRQLGWRQLGRRVPHTLIVPEEPPDTILEPSGENCTRRLAWRLSSRGSHRLTERRSNSRRHCRRAH